MADDAEPGDPPTDDSHPERSDLLTALVAETIVEIAVAVARLSSLAGRGDVARAGRIELLIEAPEEKAVQRDHRDDTDHGKRHQHDREQARQNPEAQGAAIPPSRVLSVRDGTRRDDCHVAGRNT